MTVTLTLYGGVGEIGGNKILAFSLWDMADLLDLEYLAGKRPGGRDVHLLQQPGLR